ncbi:MAG: hypothetical protein NZM37_08990, partial [Sandaracinaceae bacterium]|nr:hypothetical protein [Sandaracinaceae bacterium]
SQVQRLLASGRELDLKRWMIGVDLSADRLGFLLANDLETIAAILHESPEEAAALPPKDRLREIFGFATSEAYFALRKRMGIAIQ